MRPRPRFVVTLLLLACALLPESARAGAWLRPVGGAYVETSWLYLDTDRRHDCRGDEQPADSFDGSFREHQAFVYGEFGLHRRVTALVSMAVKDARITDAVVPEYGTRSTGDLRLGARWGLATGAIPVSLETLVSVPTYPESDPRARVGERAQFLPAGTGRIGLETRLQAGASLYPLPLYANLALGRRERGGVFGDQWLLAGEVGATFDRVFLKSDLRAVFADGDVCASEAAAGAVTVHEQSLRWNPKASWRLAGDLWIGAGASFLLSGRNTLDGTQWSLSVAWQRRPDAGG